jgi:hypothetical protein
LLIVKGDWKASAHFAASSGQYEARLDQQINKEVRDDAGREVSSRDNENNGESDSKTAGRNCRPERGPNAFSHQTPDTVRESKGEPRDDDLQHDPGMMSIVQMVHEPAPEDDFLQNAGTDRDGDAEQLEPRYSKKIFPHRRQPRSNPDVKPADHESEQPTEGCAANVRSETEVVEKAGAVDIKIQEHPRTFNRRDKREDDCAFAFVSHKKSLKGSKLERQRTENFGKAETLKF